MKASFMYSESEEIIYCRRCGQIAGEPTKCPGYSSHDFASTTSALVCARCGVFIGKATKCPGYSSHKFQRVE